MEDNQIIPFSLETAYTHGRPAHGHPAPLWIILRPGFPLRFLLGVTGSGKTFSMANVIARCNRLTLVLAPNKTLAAQLYGEFRELFPRNAVEYFVISFYYDYYQPEAYVPASDTCGEKKIRPSTTTSTNCATPPPTPC